MTFSKNILLVLIFLGVIAFGSSVFIVEQTSQALVLQFGELKRVIKEPGLHFKIPYLQTVNIYEKRILDFDLPEVPITTGDQKRMMVDTYMRYRIEDVIQFYRTVRPADETGVAIQFQPIISSVLRQVLGKVNLTDLLSEKRSAIMHQINDGVKTEAKKLGIEIVDVRIKRTELPEENRVRVYEKMNAELEKIAKDYRAKGAEKAKEISAKAEKERTVILAEAQRDAQQNRGEGEAKALEIVADALGEDPEFYGFVRSMDNLKVLDEESSMVLSTDNEAFKYMNKPDSIIASSPNVKPTVREPSRESPKSQPEPQQDQPKPEVMADDLTGADRVMENPAQGVY